MSLKHSYLSFAIFGTVLIWPQLSTAEIFHTDGYGSQPNVYVSNKSSHLIHIGHDGDKVTGQVWLGDEWSDAENIFTDESGDFEFNGDPDFHFKEFRSNSLVIQDDRKVITYSDAYGFQYADLSIYEEIELNQYKNQLLLIDCGDIVTVTRWTEADGFGTAVTLDGALCGEDLSWFVSSKGVLIDYYTGSAYNISNNFALIDAIDLSSIGYGDDLDAQGIGPSIMKKKNGDMVFGFNPGDDFSDVDFDFTTGYGSDVEYLWGYSTVTGAWQPLVSSLEANITRGQLFQTPNRRHIFAVGSTSDQKTWHIYRWNSNTGWQREQIYEFDEAATFIQPDLSKKKKAFDWGFWFNKDDTLKVYRWIQNAGYEELTKRNLDCSDTCNFSMGVSKKGKVFFGWDRGAEVLGSVWTADNDSWEDKTFEDASGGQMTDIHVSAKGQFIIQFSSDSNNHLIRWTPDGGWGMISTVTNGIYFNGDKLYLTDLDKPTNELTISRWQWSMNSTAVIETFENILSLDEGHNFIYNNHLFLSVLTGDDERKLEVVPL